MQFRTRAIHVGHSQDRETGAIIPPIHLASTFVQANAGKPQAYDYSRSGNPTRKCLEETLCSLEGGSGALAFASGMAATHAVSMLLKPGDHILASSDIYGGTYRLFHQILPALDIKVSMANALDPSAFEKSIQENTRLIWIESIGNPGMSVTDIKACAQIAGKYNALLAVDSTFTTPVLTRPLELGADIVMHSATKYFGGHSDMLGGALIVNDQQLYDQLYYIQNATGAVLAPLDCYLCSRGLKTLELRVREQCRTALKIAEFLAASSSVKQVNYPGLKTDPGHQLASQQMDQGFGAMISFEINGDYEAAKRVVESTKLFRLAVSLGAVESLIEQPASMSHATYSPADRQAHGISDGMIRLSIGLEAFEDLQTDLTQAFSKI